MNTTAPDPCPPNGATASGEENATRNHFFTLFVNDTIFGLDVREAQAIFRVGAITPIPLMNKAVAGLISLRGKVIAAVSLRHRVGAPMIDGFQENLAICVERGNERFALLVDRVGDVLSLPASARTEIPPHCDASQARYTRELYVFESKLIPILDVQRLFDFASAPPA